MNMYQCAFSPKVRLILSLFFLFCCIQTGISQVVLRGNVVPNGEIAMSSNNGKVWQVQVTLDDSWVYLFREKYVFFDDIGNNYQSDNIKINGGAYTVNYNSETKEYSFFAPVDEYRISGFGSSVMNGENSHNKSYMFHLGELLEERYKTGMSQNPFYTSNISIGGSNTKSLLSRYDDLIHDHSRYVMLGLSMGNEGLAGKNNDKNAVFERFRANMETLVQKIKDEGKIPIVMNNYPRGGFSLEDYKYVKDMNILIHQWDCASVNILGTVDDGTGNWAPGFVEEDNQHPNIDGYQEILCSIPSSLFDALASGKKQPVRDVNKSLIINNGGGIMFRGEGSVHSFTIGLMVKGNAQGPLLTYEATDGISGEMIIDNDGHVIYDGITSAISLADNEWHLITLTHNYACGWTKMYVDKELAGVVKERINYIGDIFVGAKNPSIERMLSELFFWRSSLTQEEVSAIVDGKMLKSSLELYVPTESTTSLNNKAMSTNTVSFCDWSYFGLESVDRGQNNVVELNGIHYHLFLDKHEAEVVAGENKYAGNISIPQFVNYNGVDYEVTSIGKQAFYDCSDLSSVNFPESLEMIDDFAFHGCKGLTSIELPDNITSIGNNVFAKCSGLVYVKLPLKLKIVGSSAFNRCSNLTVLEMPKEVISLGYLAFAYCTSLSSTIDIPNVDTLCYDLYQGCSNINSLEVASNISYIDHGAFASCTGITTVVIPNSVVSIGEYAFYGCSSCKSITIGSNVDIIHGSAFSLCSSLSEVYCLSDKVPNTHRDAFADSNIKEATLYVPFALIDKYKNAYPWKYFKTIESLPVDETGIIDIENNQIESNENTKIHSIYTFDGKRKETYIKGLNIVRMKNGQSKIVIKK